MSHGGRGSSPWEIKIPWLYSFPNKSGDGVFEGNITCLNNVLVNHNRGVRIALATQGLVQPVEEPRGKKYDHSCPRACLEGKWLQTKPVNYHP